MPAQDNLKADTVAGLVRHFERIYREHMQDLPIVNARLQVEAVAFQDFEGHELGVLITPWFMNLVLLPAGHQWHDSAQGDASTVDFPSGPVEFTTSRDEELGTYLTAVLYRSVSDLPDQPTACDVANRLMTELLVPARDERLISRRELLLGLRSR